MSAELDRICCEFAGLKAIDEIFKEAIKTGILAAVKLTEVTIASMDPTAESKGMRLSSEIILERFGIPIQDLDQISARFEHYLKMQKAGSN